MIGADALPNVSANWVFGFCPPVVCISGAAAPLTLGAGIFGADETLPPLPPPVTPACDAAELICCIDLTAPAIVDAILNAALTVLIVTQGCPNVKGDAAAAFAFAIPVLAIICPIAAAWDITIPAIANALFLPASWPNTLPNCSNNPK